MSVIAIFSLGLVIGLIASVLGLGGGVLIVPLLPLLGELTLRETLGTSLFTVLLVVSYNTWHFHREKKVEWRLSAILGMGSLIGAYVAGSLTAFVPEVAIFSVFLVVLILLALRSFFIKAEDLGVESDSTKKGEGSRYSLNSMQLIGIGLFAGAISGFTGVGGGVFFSTLLVGFHLVENDRIAPTSNAAMLFTSLAGSFAYMESMQEVSWQRLGLIRIDYALLLFVGAGITSQFGRKYQHKLSRKAKGIILGILLVLLAIKVILDMMGKF